MLLVSSRAPFVCNSWLAAGERDDTPPPSVQACFAGAPDKASCAAAQTAAFTVASSPLVAVLAGVNTVAGGFTPVTLDCGQSVDPDGTPGPLSFEWRCDGPRGKDACLTGALQPLEFEPNQAVQARLFQKPPLCLPRTSACCGGHGPKLLLSHLLTPRRLPSSRSPQTIPVLQQATYNFTCTVSKPGRGRASAVGYLQFRQRSVPAISVDTSLSAALVNPSARIVLRGNVTSAVPQSLRVAWAQTAGPAVNLSDPLVAATAVSSQSFVLKPGALAPDTSYGFALNATDFSGTAVAQVSFRTAPAPRQAGGAVVVASSNVSDAGLPVGTAYATLFTVSALGWTPSNGDGPLAFEVTYLVPGQQMDPITLLPFQPVSNIRTTLPPGLPDNGFRVTIQLCAARREPTSLMARSLRSVIDTAGLSSCWAHCCLCSPPVAGL